MVRAKCGASVSHLLPYRCVKDTGELSMFVQNLWVKVAGRAKALSVARKDKIVMAAKNGDLCKLPLVDGQWQRMPGTAESVR